MSLVEDLYQAIFDRIDGRIDSLQQRPASLDNASQELNILLKVRGHLKVWGSDVGIHQGWLQAISETDTSKCVVNCLEQLKSCVGTHERSQPELLNETVDQLRVHVGTVRMRASLAKQGDRRQPDRHIRHLIDAISSRAEHEARSSSPPGAASSSHLETLYSHIMGTTEGITHHARGTRETTVPGRRTNVKPLSPVVGLATASAQSDTPSSLRAGHGSLPLAESDAEDPVDLGGIQGTRQSGALEQSPALTIDRAPKLQSWVLSIPVVADPAAAFEDVMRIKELRHETASVTASRGSAVPLTESDCNTSIRSTDIFDDDSGGQTILLQGMGARFAMEEGKHCGIVIRANGPRDVIPKDEQRFRGRWDTAGCFDMIPTSRVNRLCLRSAMTDVGKCKSITGLGRINVPVLGRLTTTIQIQGYERAVQVCWYVIDDVHEGDSFDCTLGLATITECCGNEIEDLLDSVMISNRMDSA